jgi:hypothetical protein
MHELTRLAYLDALEIETYVSRSQLPAAAPSRRLRIVRQPSVRQPPARQPSVPAAVVSPRQQIEQAPTAAPTGAASGAGALKASLQSEQPIAPIPEETTPRASTGAEAPDIPVFSVLAVQLGGCYWLDEIPPGRNPGPDYLQLLQSICFALGWDTGNPALEQFNWPLAQGGSLDRGVSAARAGFTGFLTGRLERLQPARVIVLGDLDPAWCDPQAMAGLPVTTTVSGWKMLRQPKLKRQAWLDLQALRHVD